MQIKGTVTGTKNGLSIPGVSIVVKDNANIGTSTDINGKYSITVPSSAKILLFTSIGMKPKEIPINGRSVIDVVLEPDVLKMDEVVVVAYGTIKKASFTGSASVVNNEKLQKISTPSVAKALVGSSPGIMVNSASGQPGSQPTIRIRGTGSIKATSSPLYVVDGIPITTGNYSSFGYSGSDVLSILNSNDIESVTVLKDAAAASLYGSAAANGVIVITTQKGREGESKISFTANYGFQSLAKENYNMMSSDEIYKIWYDNYYAVAVANNVADPISKANQDTQTALGHNPYNIANPLNEIGSLVPSAKNIVNTNWRNVVFNTGKTQDYILSASGGNNKLNYYASGGYANNEGIGPASDFKRFSGKLNLSSQVREYLKFGMENTLGHSIQNTSPNGSGGASPYRMALLISGAIPEYEQDANGNFNLDEKGNKQYNYSNPVAQDYNPIGLSELNEYKTKAYRTISSIWGEVNFLKDFRFKTIGNVDYIGLTERLYYNPYHGDGNSVSGRGNRFSKTSLNWTISNTLTYSKELGFNSFDVLLGYEAYENFYERIDNGAIGYMKLANKIFPELANASKAEDADSYTIKSSKSSMFSRLNYDFKDKYYLSGSLRRDGSSRFGSDKRHGIFYSISAAWRISEESFMKSLNWLSSLKIRASYGTSGNDDITTFLYLGLYSPKSYDGLPGLIYTQLSNSKLHWEANKNTNIALDLTLFNRFSITYEYYTRTATDLLYDKPLPYSTGFDGITTNLADMKNMGHELDLKANIFQKNVVWDLGLNLSKNTNELLKIVSPQVNSNDKTKYWEEGGSIYEYYLEEWAGVNPENGNPQWYKDDENGDKVKTSNYNEAKRYKQGTSTPDLFGAFTSDLSYKGFDLSLMLYYSIGGKIYDNVERQLFYNGSNKGHNMTADAIDYWTPVNIGAKYPRFDVDGNLNSFNRSTLFLHDATYIKLRNVRLSYTIPNSITSKIKFSHIKVFANAENIFTWVKDKDLKVFDPELGISGNNFFRSPAPRVFSLGINVNL